MSARKTIFSAAIVIVCVQLAHSLTCYTCVNPNDCKSPRETTCTNMTANETGFYLGVHHQNVRNVSGSNRFDCLALKYTYANNKSVASQLHGCVHPDVNPCHLSLKPQYSSYRRSWCNLCYDNKCNKNPAAKMSSSLYTVLTAAVGLALAKIYA